MEGGGSELKARKWITPVRIKASTHLNNHITAAELCEQVQHDRAIKQMQTVMAHKGCDVHSVNVQLKLAICNDMLGSKAALETAMLPFHVLICCIRSRSIVWSRMTVSNVFSAQVVRISDY